jgi:hypothetical protein
MSINKDIFYYLAGPMTGCPQFNIPLFREAAMALRMSGFHVVSPAECDSEATMTAALESEDGALIDGKLNGHTWGDFLVRDIKIVADEVGGVILLPGWENSRGARLEVFVGLLCNRVFANYWPDEKVAVSVSTEQVRKILRMNLP